MRDLFEQLENNTEALESLTQRYITAENSAFYKIFSDERKRAIELMWILKIRKRVLRMRFRILENINSQTLKEMQSASVQSRELNLKVA